MSKIALSGNASGTGTFTIASPNGNTDRTLTLPDESGSVLIQNSAGQQVLNSAGTAAAPAIVPTGDTNTGIFFPAADTIAFSEGGAEAMRIDSDGDVGIGTTSPSGKLNLSDGTSCQLNINSAAAGFTREILFSTGTNTQEGKISCDNAAGELRFESGRSGTSSYIQTFYTNNTERARITSGGDLLVNQTAAFAACDGRLSVTKNSASTASPTISVINANASAVYVSFSDSNSVFGSITRSGSSTVYGTSSDYRLKENIAPMTGALARVLQLNPVTYTWKQGGKSAEGFIAHELQEICPDAVIGEKDATEIRKVEVSPAIPATYDDDGNELTPAVEAVYEEREVPLYQGVDTSFLVATLTAAIQELKAITDTQAQTISALSTQLALCEARIAALETQE